MILDYIIMGGACSRKRDQQVEDILNRGVSGKYSKSSSSKWLATSLSRSGSDVKRKNGECPSLMELCVRKIQEDIDRYTKFSDLPRDISQQIFDELVYSQRLTLKSLEAFRDCAIQDLYLGEYPGVNDDWMDVISSQSTSLLSVDFSGSDITDSGLVSLKGCTNLESLNFNFCDQISNRGLVHLSGKLYSFSHISFVFCLSKFSLYFICVCFLNVAATYLILNTFRPLKFDEPEL
jgi:hypothetical protein